MDWLLDIIRFLFLTVPCIWLLTSFKDVAISFVLLSICGVLGWLVQQKKKLLEFNASWMNWFEISKFFGGVAAIGLISYCRHYDIYSHSLTLLILGINIIEAVLSDALTNGHFNAVAGIILLLNTPLSIDDSKLKTSQIFRFPVSIPWILCYTTWNGAFSYGFNYSPSTRLMLLTSLIVSFGIIQDPAAWLGARTYALMVNMLFRALRLTYLYKPNQSYITKSCNMKNQYIRHLWGIANCFCVIILTWIS